jgi:hypothetical protein
MGEVMKTYKLFLVYSGCTKVKQHTFGKCREGLEAAYSYAENAAAFAIFCEDELIEVKNQFLLAACSL